MPTRQPDWMDAEINQHLQAARARAQANKANQVHAVEARYDNARDRIVVVLSNGAEFSQPPALAQGLDGADAQALGDVEISPSGLGLHWPALDADLSVTGLLAAFLAMPPGCVKLHPEVARPAARPKLQLRGATAHAVDGHARWLPLRHQRRSRCPS